MGPVLEFLVVILSVPFLWSVFFLGLIFTIPVYILKLTIGKLGKILHPDWSEMLSGKDILFAEDPSSTSIRPHSILFGYLTIESGFNLKDFRYKFLTEVVKSLNPVTGELNFPKLQQYTEFWCGYGFWKWDKSFTIEKHVHLLKEGQEDSKIYEDELMKILGDLSNKPFKPNQSPWEYIIIPNYFPKHASVPSCLIIRRMHHTIGDGYSILKTLITYECGLNLREFSHSLPIEKRNSSAITTRGCNLLIDSIKLITMPYTFTKHMLTIDNNPWFLSRKKLSKISNVGMTNRIRVELIKKISKKYKVSFSAILFSALGGGINKYFRRHDKIPPEYIQCFTPFPRSGHPDNKMVNHFSAAIIRLFTGIHDPVLRIYENEDDLSKMKRSSLPIFSHILTVMLSVYPIRCIQLFGSNWFATSILSNFPGPTQILKLFKTYPMSDSMFWTPQLNGNAGLGISTLTYAGYLRFALNIDSAILPSRNEVKLLCNYIEEDLLSLLNQSEMKLLDENQNEEITNNDEKSFKKFSSPSSLQNYLTPNLRLRSVS